jgi:glycosyltransferase involved in cell wall biosynthesis
VSSRPLCARPITRHFATKATRAPAPLLCQGETWQKFFGAAFDIPAARCPVVRNWTATPTLLSVGAERSYKPGSPLSILFVSWLDDAKGLPDLLTAFRDVTLTLSVDCRLWLAGEGSASARARVWTTDNGLSDRLRFLGWVDEQQGTAAFSGRDIGDQMSLGDMMIHLPDVFLEKVDRARMAASLGTHLLLSVRRRADEDLSIDRMVGRTERLFETWIFGSFR